MKNNLLFINQNQDIIQEFLGAMEGREVPMEIDTADSGLEAAILLKKKTYKVVVTGMDLPTYDGTKIIEYLNKNYPQTICIVYTWRLELANLWLLVNERRVFRIFQRPADYSHIYEAIVDGFVKYDKREADALDRRDLEQALEERLKQVEELKQVAKEQPWEKREIVKFLGSLLNVFAHNIKSGITGREQWQVVKYEKKMLLWFLDNKGNGIDNLEDVRQDLCQRFQHPEHRQTVDIQIDEISEPMEREFCRELHFVIWLLLTRFAMLTSVFEAHVALIPVNQERFRVRIEGLFPEGAWGAGHESRAAQVTTSMTQTILECFSERFTQSISDEKVIYFLEMQGWG